MSEYISREEFEKRIKLYDTEDHTDKALYNFAHNHMICCPSADVRPNIHGHWEDDREGFVHCSKCGGVIFSAQRWSYSFIICFDLLHYQICCFFYY